MRALVAMSGGVDSSVAAVLLKKAGYDIGGAIMQLCEKKTEDGVNITERDISDAAASAEKLGIDFSVIDLRDTFKKKVINQFVSFYEQGLTPNPCVECNKTIKFGAFLDWAVKNSFDKIATGHYAKIIESDGRFLLKKAVDKTKDQSYVLAFMTQTQLKNTIFPLGDLTKEEARKIAEENGLLNAKKSDSQDICFVPDGKYAEVIRQNSKKDYPCGNFVDAEGNVLGVHKGIINYTIGQRRGLGLALPASMYVLEKRIETNEVVLGFNDQLFCDELEAEGFNWIAYETPPERIKCKAKIRYNQSEQPATAIPLADGRVRVVFDEPQRAITPGQAVVLYDSDIVLGGGIIR